MATPEAGDRRLEYVGGSDTRPPAIIHAVRQRRPRVGVALATRGETPRPSASGRFRAIDTLAIERRIELRHIIFRDVVYYAARPLHLRATAMAQPRALSRLQTASAPASGTAASVGGLNLAMNLRSKLGNVIV